MHLGTTTLGHVASGGARVGFRASTSILWEGTAYTAGDDLWKGARVTVPYEFSYTAPNGALRVGSFTMSYTISRFSGVVTPFTDLKSVTQEEPPPTVCGSL